MSIRMLLVSPVRDEAGHIERVVRSVAAQTRPPDRWLVVDDGSSDGTLEILRRLEGEVPFLRVLAAPAVDSGPAHPARRLSLAAEARAYNSALRLEDLRAFTHIGKLDGDIELPPEWFERLLGEFASDPRLGITGGTLVERQGDRMRPIRIPLHHIHGALKLYSRSCFEAIGGIEERLGWDTIDETYARMGGFATRHVPGLVAIHHRPWGSAGGRLRGRARHGECAYILRYGWDWVLLRSAKVALASPVGLSGVAFLYGYARAAARRAPRVEDEEFRRFVRTELRGRIRRALRLPAPAPSA